MTKEEWFKECYLALISNSDVLNKNQANWHPGPVLTPMAADLATHAYVLCEKGPAAYKVFLKQGVAWSEVDSFTGIPKDAP